MQRMNLSLMALYRHSDGTVLSELALPEALAREDFIGRLLIECGEMEVYLANPDTMQAAVGFWSRGRLEAWEKIAALPGYEYNPIWNVDAEITREGTSESRGTSSGTNNESRTFTRDRDQTDTLTNAHNDTRTPDLTETKTPNLTETTSPSGVDITTNYIAADNVEGFSYDTKTEKGFENRRDQKTTTGTEQTRNTGSEQTSGGYTDTDVLAEDIEDTETKTGTTSGTDSREGEETFHEVRRGNIGVTMTQQLLQAEKDLWTDFDLVGQIIGEFKQEFLILVY